MEKKCSEKCDHCWYHTCHMDEEEGRNPFNMRCLVPIQRIMLDILKQNPPIFVCIMQDRTHPGKIN